MRIVLIVIAVLLGLGLLGYVVLVIRLRILETAHIARVRAKVASVSGLCFSFCIVAFPWVGWGSVYS